MQYDVHETSSYCWYCLHLYLFIIVAVDACTFYISSCLRLRLLMLEAV
jgi:hypothetical protein